MRFAAAANIVATAPLLLAACAVSPTPPDRPLTESELASLTDLAVGFRCANQRWPRSVSELQVFAENESVPFDWKLIEAAELASGPNGVLEVHLHPEALPARHRVTYDPPSAGSSTAASIRIAPRGCAPGERPDTDAEACDRVSADRIRSVDVAVVIDSSVSTSLPFGSDVDKDGSVGSIAVSVGEPEGRVPDPTGTRVTRVVRGASAWFQEPPSRAMSVQSTDPGDSVLAAQVAATRNLIDHLAQADARFVILSIPSREPDADHGGDTAMPVRALTSDLTELHVSLDRLLESGSSGGSDFSAAMVAANESLEGSVDTTSSRRRLVALMSDAPFSTSEGDEGEFHRADPAMKPAAQAAIDAGIVFHTFGLRRAALAKPPHALSRIAGATGGEYRPVGGESDLFCELTRALAPD